MSDRRNVVVTGAASGVGAAVARAFGALGWSVAVGARHLDRVAETARNVEAAGGTALVAELNARSAESVDAFFDRVPGTFGAATLGLFAAHPHARCRSRRGRASAERRAHGCDSGESRGADP